eukprot:TRINITY_DN5516_c0_g1_i3.p2 TRINITY_DN5516_c0_g1~~TRINITY_DN5516_c0_g1_i3.p2  ORF type:complete len:147 (-),score=30.56 TRINITY_DN5516_c0_g1_i3:118-558(-)
MYEIIIKNPGQRGMVGKLIPGAYKVGSGPDCHIQLQDQGISPVHAQFSVSDGSFKIIDLDSETGTFVDEQLLTPNALYEAVTGSTVRIGSIEIVLRGSASPPLSEPPESKPEISPEKEQKIKENIAKAERMDDDAKGKIPLSLIHI